MTRADPPTTAFPDRVAPMLAHAGAYPAREEEFGFELKWDGIRAIVSLNEGQVNVRSRNLNDITEQYPELAGLAAAYPGRQMMLDGEIVAPDEEGRPSFERLQSRLGVTQRALARARSETHPVVFIVFDVLFLDGRETMSLPYEERRALLDSLALHGDAWRVSPVRFGDGRGLLAMEGFEGVVAKRLGSTYVSGSRSHAWIKIKRVRRQELVIGGWSAGQGSRAGRIGALLVGYHEPAVSGAASRSRFHYAGSVGTGFTDAKLDELQRLLTPDVRETSPFDTPVDRKDVTFVEPRYVGEFEFTEWTSDGKLRHPSFKGLREDKEARDVTREEL